MFYLIVNKSHEISKTNNALVRLSIFSNFPTLSVSFKSKAFVLTEDVHFKKWVASLIFFFF